ncbi:MAG: zinc ABC transporter substrate-binding protein [Acidobacteriota bacterium]|nr:MAG: zinc ABC transporter substrate-binding protein [Acidobacteriota bacterium]
MRADSLIPARPSSRAAVALAAIFLAACAPGSEPASGTRGRPVVVCSVLPQAYGVERLAGDLVEIEVMIPPGASPATYEPSMQQMTAISVASLYVKVGHPNFPFERVWLDRLLENNPRLKLVDSSEGVSSRRGDPHLWVSPAHMRTMVINVEAALAELLPGQRETLQSRLKEVLDDIDALDRRVRAKLASRARDRFFVFHPAWGYFAEQYGLEQVAIEPGAREPSPEEIADVIRRAKREGVRAIFVQPQFSHRSAEVIAGEIGVRLVTIDPLARDWRANIDHVATALAEELGP